MIHPSPAFADVLLKQNHLKETTFLFFSGLIFFNDTCFLTRYFWLRSCLLSSGITTSIFKESQRWPKDDTLQTPLWQRRASRSLWLKESIQFKSLLVQKKPFLFTQGKYNWMVFYVNVCLIFVAAQKNWLPLLCLVACLLPNL